MVEFNYPYSRGRVQIYQRSFAINSLVSEGNVAFYAYMTETMTFTDDSIVIFDNILTNYGDAYSDISGTFTGKHYSSNIN